MDNIKFKTIEDLPTELQFELAQFKKCIKNLNERDTKTALIEMFKQDLIRNNAYKSMLNSQYFTSFIPS
jgi:adenine specific DNA methylase Mod